MLAEAAVIGFVPVTDFAEAERFYVGTLGLALTSRNEFALVLRAGGGVMIRCVKVEGLTPQPFTILGWETADVEAKAAELAAAGVKTLRYPWFMQDELGIWTAPDGTQVLWFNDPFGNVLSLSKHV